MSQSNTQIGTIVLPAGSDMTGKEGLLVGITEAYGEARFAFQNNENTQYPLFVIVDGDAQGKSTAALPLSPDRNVRVILEGACSPGKVLVTSAVNGPHLGKVKQLPTTPGTYHAVGIAEEAGIDGQLIRMRPIAVSKITVA
jgi:hypothetical protein